ncbi:Phosphate acetyltransferase [subsurface metagenome]
MIRTFNDLERRAKEKPVKRVALAMAQEADVLAAIVHAAENNIVEPILVGNEIVINEIAQKENLAISAYKIVHVEGESETAAKAVEIVRNRESDLLMKGKVPTATIMKAALNREKGLRGEGVLSHVTIIEAPTYHKFLLMSDSGLNIAPDLNTKVSIINNAVKVAHKLGIEKPKVGVICAVEKVNPVAMPATADAALLSKMADRGQIRGCLIDGPFGLDNAVSKKSCDVKGIKTEVGGDADILLMPYIEAANVFNKTIGYLTDYKIAGIIMGAKVPIIFTSRADSNRNKYLSILLGVSLA